MKYFLGIMCTTGDVITQTIERRKNPKQKFNFKRAAVMGSFGLFVAVSFVLNVFILF